MAHLLRQPILSLGADVLARPPRRIAVNTPASSSLRAPAATTENEPPAQGTNRSSSVARSTE